MNTSDMLITKPSKQLLDCPEELIKYIILEIDYPEDLLQLALSCKAFCRRIIPYHIQFRNLRILTFCHINDEFWEVLGQRESLPSRFQTIELLPYDCDDQLLIIPLCLLTSAMEVLEA
ncbi:hypothetical protein M422DRAFT_248157 [Sphaerobolus stellatus SS14]|uniref:F-box domain-containing protein n=1 Tax=Sphaerobolus stellatus (strain SS14) TaxID=990650 RepID=A0A0C9VJ55_SPHS4|nr:hypothetical protein M422DRAFT_248157 [Sphaerobolus stellatus SS14]